MDTVYHDARIGAAFQKLDEAERRIYEARRILEYYVKEKDKQEGEHDETPLQSRGQKKQGNLHRVGLFPGQYDNQVDAEEIESECDT